jgi:hypothetical protein
MIKQVSIQTELAVIKTDIGYIKSEVSEIKKLVQEQYVLKSEFEPVKKIVYGLVSIILVSVVGAVVTLVLRK